MGRPAKNFTIAQDTTEIVAAGTVHTNNQTAKACFDWDHFIPFYKRTLLEPVPDERRHINPEEEKIKLLTHGVRMGCKDSAADVLSPPAQNPLLLERESIRERVYHRKEHQILGRSRNADVPLPSFTKAKDFRFGDQTELDESVGQIMYPKEVEKDDPETYRRYVLSHGSYKPGEQKRHYGPEWKPIEYKETVEQKRLGNDGSRVLDALYWKYDRKNELQEKVITKELATFYDRHQPEIGKVFDSMKSTMSHLPPNHTFGTKEPESNNMHVQELMGNNASHLKSNVHQSTPKWKLPAAGLQTHRADDLDLQKTIIPVLGLLEDAALVRKITEDRVGGSVSHTKPATHFGVAHVYGLPTVRDPAGRVGKVKRLADRTNYGDEVGACGLIYPTPRNVFGIDQLNHFRQTLIGQSS